MPDTEHQPDNNNPRYEEGCSSELHGPVPVEADAPHGETGSALQRAYRWASGKQVRLGRTIPLILTGLLLLGTQLESGFATYAPGPVPEARVAGEVLAGGASAGEWRFTTVEVVPVSLTRYMWEAAQGKDLIRVAGADADVLRSRGAAQMRLSQEVSWAVAADLAAGGTGHVQARAVVTDIDPGSPAADAGVHVGDIIVSVDGTDVTASEEVPQLITTASGDTVVFGIERGDRTLEVTVTPVRDTNGPRVGVALADRPVTQGARRPDIAADGVGGPSAGLLFTLAYLDTLTDGDLTAGMVVAGTGTIEANTEIGSIDGVALKVRGAIDAGANVFLSPAANADEAANAAAGQIDVVAVETVHDAVAWLCSAGGRTNICPQQ